MRVGLTTGSSSFEMNDEFINWLQAHEEVDVQVQTSENRGG